MDLEGYSLKVTFWQCCIPDDLPLPSDVSASLLSTALSLPVTAASLSSLPLSSGSGAAGSCEDLKIGSRENKRIHNTANKRNAYCERKYKRDG